MTRFRITNSLFVRSTLPNPPAQPHLLRSGRRRHAPRLRDRLRDGRAQLELDHPEVGGGRAAHVEPAPTPSSASGRSRAPDLPDGAARDVDGARLLSQPENCRGRRSRSSRTGAARSRSRRAPGSSRPGRLRAGSTVGCTTPSRHHCTSNTRQERRSRQCAELTVRG